MAFPNPEPAMWFGSSGEPPRGKVRCGCQYCGAHVIAQAGYRVAGQCTNCGSFDITVLGDGGRLTPPAASAVEHQ